MAEEKSPAYIRAEKRVEAKLGFYKSLTTYLGVNLVLFLIDLFTSPGKWWFYWPLLFWGIGVLLHFIRVFVTGGLFSERIKEGMMRKECGKKRRETQPRLRTFLPGQTEKPGGVSPSYFLVFSPCPSEGRYVTVVSELKPKGIPRPITCKARSRPVPSEQLPGQASQLQDYEALPGRNV